MTAGIYQLTFASGKRYIGKSTNIEDRINSHAKSFLLDKASEAMQWEYDRYGDPTAQIIMEAHPDHLDMLETCIIFIEKPELNTVIKQPLVPIADMDLFFVHSELLQVPTASLLKLIAKLSKRIGELEDDVDEAIMREESYHNDLVVLQESLKQ